jgi:chromosomal replication initiator protein
MNVSVELLPAIARIVTDCEDRLLAITGSHVKVKLMYTPTDVNDEALQNLVCEYFNIHWHQILGPRRTREIVMPRSVYWWLSRKWLHTPANKLARDFKMHHTTVLHMCNKIGDLMEVRDPYIHSKVATIENILSAKM